MESNIKIPAEKTQGKKTAKLIMVAVAVLAFGTMAFAAYRYSGLFQASLLRPSNFDSQKIEMNMPYGTMKNLRVTERPFVQICGNGKLEGGEECEDGNVVDGDGCSSTCATEMICKGVVCQSGFACQSGRCVDLCTTPLVSCPIGFTCQAGQCNDERCLGVVCPTGALCKEGRCVSQCGNGKIDAGESCDDAGLVSGDGCSAVCAKEFGFECAGTPSVCKPIDTCLSNPCDVNANCVSTGPGANTCTCKTGYVGDGKACALVPVCGNGNVESGEACDKSNLSGQTCATALGAGYTGTLVCGADCKSVIATGCVAPAVCGNGVAEANEVCDKTSLKGLACPSGTTGVPTCASDCKSVSNSSCVANPVCGNNSIETGEVCDGTNFGTKTCVTEKGSQYTKGYLICQNCKTISTTSCKK